MATLPSVSTFPRRRSIGRASVAGRGLKAFFRLTVARFYPNVLRV